MEIKLNDIVVLKPIKQIPNGELHKSIYDYYANKLLKVVRIEPLNFDNVRKLNLVYYREIKPNKDNVCREFAGLDNIVVNIKEGI